MVVRKLPMVQVECVARGYLTGSGLLDTTPPARCAESDCLRVLGRPTSCPSRSSPRPPRPNKVNTTRTSASPRRRGWGAEQAAALRTATLDIYSRGAQLAAERGIIWPTPFEFGLGTDGELVLADEVLTPTRRGGWDAAGYRAGQVQPSFDKQIVLQLAHRARFGLGIARPTIHRPNCPRT